MFALILVCLIISVLAVLGFLHFRRVRTALEHSESVSNALSGVFDKLKVATDSTNPLTALESLIEARTSLQMLVHRYGVDNLSEISGVDVIAKQDVVEDHIERCRKSIFAEAPSLGSSQRVVVADVDDE